MASSPLDRAIRLALIAHEGQEDWCGRPFILHPMRVGMALLPAGLACEGVLHDSVEDSGGLVTRDLIENSCGPLVAFTVGLLTHARGVSYDTYIGDVSRYRDATLVKLADLADNLAPDRCMVDSDARVASLVKHAKALQFLREHARTRGWI